MESVALRLQEHKQYPFWSLKFIYEIVWSFRASGWLCPLLGLRVYGLGLLVEGFGLRFELNCMARSVVIALEMIVVVEPSIETASTYTLGSYPLWSPGLVTAHEPW